MKPRLLLALGIIFGLTLLITPWIGPESVRPADALSAIRGELSPRGMIFWQQRLPRVLLALIAGGTLAVAGAAFQALFRNPLVEPFTLGISGGSALGAFLAISIPGLWFTWGPFGSIQVTALLGAAASLFLIDRLAGRSARLSVSTLLLAGVTVSIICSGAILLLTYVATPNALVVYQRWMMGGVDIIGYRDLIALLPMWLPGLALVAGQSDRLNHLALGEEMALGHGVNVRSVQRRVFVGGGLATAAVVSLVGPIGFVGLIVPHAVRRLGATDQRTILPGAFLLGGTVLTVCDAAARTVIAPTELPVGIITAVIGGPLFIRMLVSRGRRSRPQ